MKIKRGNTVASIALKKGQLTHSEFHGLWGAPDSLGPSVLWSTVSLGPSVLWSMAMGVLTLLSCLSSSRVSSTSS